MNKGNKTVLLMTSVCLTLLLVFSIVSCVPSFSDNVDKVQKKKTFEIEQRDEQNVNSKETQKDVNTEFIVYETQTFEVTYPSTESDFEIVVDDVNKTGEGNVEICVTTKPDVCVYFECNDEKMMCVSSGEGIAKGSFSMEKAEYEISICAQDSGGDITPTVYLRVF